MKTLSRFVCVTSPPGCFFSTTLLHPTTMSLQSFSVPTSPAMTRSSKTQPVTPQRLPRHQHRHSQSAYRSPLTPSSPYTPLSFRSAGSTGSSTLTTPDNVAMILKKRLFPAGSPEVQRTATILTDGQDKSLADIADNWRSRANENGIKVSSYRAQDDSHYGDDEGVCIYARMCALFHLSNACRE